MRDNCDKTEYMKNYESDKLDLNNKQSTVTCIKANMATALYYEKLVIYN